MKSPLIIAHRGAPGRRENTLAGFREGVAKGADWIELDVHQTADDALVVFHDFRIGLKPIARFTLAEARHRARRLRRIQLPTLEDVLEAVPAHIGLNIEIKPPGIGGNVLRVLVRRGAVERALVTSFHLPTVRELARLEPRVRTGLLTRSRLSNSIAALRHTGAAVLLPSFRLASESLVHEVQRGGFHVFVWTVNRPADLRRMLTLGVDGVITDFPERLTRMLDNR